MERQSRRRRRPALSCLECRRRKIKCDRSDPCAHCVSNKATCTYRLFRSETASRPSGSRPSPPADSSSPAARSARTQPVLGAPDLTTEQHHGGAPGTRVAESELPGSENNINGLGMPAPNRHQFAGITPGDLLSREERFNKFSASSPLHGLSETGQEILTSQLGLEKSQIFLNKTRTLRSSHWMGAAKEVSLIADLIRHRLD